ncbi:MAG: Txe/YoeB family addiction module toxin [Defluviitaleaceae bacterium]|nr:Txe/YoeB family addiction module toxin [Defluviitaleaceae bacterium]
MGYKLKYTYQADKDARLLERARLDKIAKNLLAIIGENPYQNPPAYEKLQGDMKGSYSRRINKQHRIVYHFTHRIILLHLSPLLPLLFLHVCHGVFAFFPSSWLNCRR